MGSFTKAFGSLIQGEGTAQANEYNASIARQNQIIAYQQSEAAVEAQQRDAARAMGAAIASYGASGVQSDNGSPMDVLADSARLAELDRLTIQYNYQLKALGFDQQAKLQKMAATSARTASYFQAAEDLTPKFGAGGSGTPIPA